MSDCFCYCINVVTNSTEQTLCREADDFTADQLINFHRILRFITRHTTVLSARWIPSTISIFISLTCTLILSFNLCLRLPRDLLSLGCPIKNFYSSHLSFSHVCYMPCKCLSLWFDHQNNIRLVKSENYEAPHLVIITLLLCDRK